MEYTVDEVLKYIEEEDAKFIRLAFRDAFGVQKNLSVMPGEIRKAFGLGIPVNARSIAGFEEGPHSLLYLKPDSSTLAVLPWRPDNGRVLRMFCELVTPEGEEAPADTRTLLRKAEAEAREEGVEFRFGAETEFYLFLKDENGNPTRTPYDRAGYMDIAPLDRCENIRREICLTAERMGLTPERSHHEQGPGQNEIDFHYAKPVKAADQMTTFRMVVSTMADRYGLHADFSPRPLPGEPRNGCRINIYAADRDGGDVSEYAAAGILRRLRDITVFLNPPGEAGAGQEPAGAAGSGEGIAQLMYVGKYQGKNRVELRAPDASGNPYLVYALLIYAGLEGIRERLALPGPGEEIPPLPGSSEEAELLASGSSFVRGILPEKLIRKYCPGKALH